ncbi:hypothetical protein ACFVZL_28480 [Streptomyces sp. NPDC058320]|uniref:hypothetical protein n=1 Tax=unclassified Streptomyces TaxID=2593676 RepID=UPI003630F708
MGGEATAKWTFTASGSGDVATPVRLLNASFDAPLDELNRARPDRLLDVRADDSGAVDGLKSAQTLVTSDGGAAWHVAPTHRDDDGRYRFSAPTDLLTSGGFLGVRLTAEDGAGHTVDLALPRAIPVG